MDSTYRIKGGAHASLNFNWLADLDQKFQLEQIFGQLGLLSWNACWPDRCREVHFPDSVLLPELGPDSIHLTHSQVKFRSITSHSGSLQGLVS